MKKLLILLALLACAFTTTAQEMSCTFVQKKTLKATNKVIPGEGKITFTAPDQLKMTYDVPEGEYLIIDGMSKLRQRADRHLRHHQEPAHAQDAQHPAELHHGGL